MKYSTMPDLKATKPAVIPRGAATQVFMYVCNQLAFYYDYMLLMYVNIKLKYLQFKFKTLIACYELEPN